MVSIAQSAQQSQTSAPISLYTLDATVLGGDVLRFTAGDVGTDIPTFDGNDYPPYPIRVEGFERVAAGPLPTPKLVIGNVNKVAAGLIAQYSDLLGATFTRLRTQVRFLDGEPDADPLAHWPIDVYRVERKAALSKEFAEWELAAAMDQEGRSLPGRIMTHSCDWRYRVWDPVGMVFDYSKAQCPYNLSPMFDLDGNPTSDPTQDACPKQLEGGCYKRFGRNNALPFGGFPGMSLY